MEGSLLNEWELLKYVTALPILVATMYYGSRDIMFLVCQVISQYHMKRVM